MTYRSYVQSTMSINQDDVTDKEEIDNLPVVGLRSGEAIQTSTEHSPPIGMHHDCFVRPLIRLDDLMKRPAPQSIDGTRRSI